MFDSMPPWAIAVSLFNVVVIVSFSFYDDFCNYTTKEKRYKVEV